MSFKGAQSYLTFLWYLQLSFLHRSALFLPKSLFTLHTVRFVSPKPSTEPAIVVDTPVVTRSNQWFVDSGQAYIQGRLCWGKHPWRLCRIPNKKWGCYTSCCPDFSEAQYAPKSWKFAYVWYCPQHNVIGLLRANYCL